MGFFGSVQVGSASRFSSKSKGAQDADPLDVSNADVQSPPAPAAYQGLRGGPDFTLEYEPNETPAVDGSADLLRTLSPFMIQVEPPMAYAAQGDKSKKDFAGILAAGHGSAPSAFSAARNAIEGYIDGGGLLTEGKSVESFVSSGVINKPTGSDGLETKDLSGKGAVRIGAPAIADLYTAVDVTMQLRALVNTPPLVLLINPQSLSMAYSKLQQYTDRTRFGFIFQAWGEEQPKLSIEAKCGAFISGGRGVQWASRRDSAAWQNLATAFQFYRHNGYIYDTVGKSNAHHFVGALSIHYDGWVYYGNMETFNYTYDEASPHGGITFSMEFTVNAMVDTSKSSLVVTPMRSPVPSLSDPRYAGARPVPSGQFDVSIGGPNEVIQTGAADFHTVNGITRGDGTTSSPSLGQKTGPGLLGAQPGNRGFAVPVVAPAVVPAVATTKLKPFRVGR